MPIVGDTAVLRAAKGFEFDDVYIVGLDDGSLPYTVSIEECLLEEECRLL